jgi:CheY-like chemotaxis protein
MRLKRIPAGFLVRAGKPGRIISGPGRYWQKEEEKSTNKRFREHLRGRSSANAGVKSIQIIRTRCVMGNRLDSKILIVDDSEALHHNYKYILKRYQCDTLGALKREEGLVKLAENPGVNLILLDMYMPSSYMSGLEFIQRIKEHEAFRNIPIIVVNTRGRADGLQEALAFAHGILTKPFTSNEVHAVMGKFLSFNEPEAATLQ